MSWLQPSVDVDFEGFLFQSRGEVGDESVDALFGHCLRAVHAGDGERLHVAEGDAEGEGERDRFFFLPAVLSGAFAEFVDAHHKASPGRLKREFGNGLREVHDVGETQKGNVDFERGEQAADSVHAQDFPADQVFEVDRGERMEIGWFQKHDVVARLERNGSETQHGHGGFAVAVVTGKFNHQARRTGFKSDSEQSLNDFLRNDPQFFIGEGEGRADCAKNCFFVDRNIGNGGCDGAALEVGGDMRVAGFFERADDHVFQIALLDCAVFRGEQGEFDGEREIAGDPGLRFARGDAGADDAGLNLLHVKRNRGAVRSENHNRCVAELNHEDTSE